MTNLTDTQIDLLIKARNKITDVCREENEHADTADIDALLNAIPAGTRNDVDLLLGRLCAKLPARPGYFASQDATLEQAAPLADEMVARYEEHVAGLSADAREMIELTRKAWNETEPIEY